MEQTTGPIQDSESPDDVTQSPNRSVGRRLLAIIILIPLTWLGVSIGTIQVFGLHAFVMVLPAVWAFPAGLAWFLPLQLSRYVLLFWLLYLGCAAAVLTLSSKRAARLAYLFLVMLVLLNAYGCVSILIAQESAP